MDDNVLRRGLSPGAEHKEEVPQVHANLHTIGIVLPVVRRVGQLKFWLSLLRRHRHNYSDTVGGRDNAANALRPRKPTNLIAGSASDQVSHTSNSPSITA